LSKIGVDNLVGLVGTEITRGKQEQQTGSTLALWIPLACSFMTRCKTGLRLSFFFSQKTVTFSEELSPKLDWLSQNWSSRWASVITETLRLSAN
jgi:hypothetical protein